MRHRDQGGKEGEGGEPAAAVRPDHLTFLGMCNIKLDLTCIV